MRVPLAAFLILAAVPAAAQQPDRAPAQAPAADRGGDPNEPIIVTGIRIQDYRDRLAACLARHCPPNEDADATLALAEALFLEGDYGQGRRDVQASLRRNRDRARDYPEPVADLYRAHSRLSRHLGEDRAALRSTYGVLDALQEGIPHEDYRHFTARLELAEMSMLMGDIHGARRHLERLIHVAHESGREDVVVMAQLRGLWYEWIADPRGGSREQLAEMARSTDPQQRMRSTGAKVLLARIYRSEGDSAHADALLAEIGRGNPARRRLLHAPPYQLTQHDPNPAQSLDIGIGTAIRSGNVIERVSENYVGKWIDVGFWVLPDGHVDGVEIVRSGSTSDWADPLLESIRGRVYSTGTEPTYRLERYTFTAGYEMRTGSHIRQRSPAARLEFLDLTVDDPPPPPPAQSAH